jgi:hypothetical protein
MKKYSREKKVCSKWVKRAASFCFILCLLLASCTGKKTEKEAKTYLTINIEKDGIRFIDVSTNQPLQYDKLVIEDNTIIDVFHATLGERAIGSLGVGIVWEEIIPPSIEPTQYTKIIGHSSLEKNMEYTLEIGVLTINHIP